MGFMGLFSKRTIINDQTAQQDIKSLPYENATASSPPHRGTYPVAGNGPNVYVTLSKSSRFNQVQTSLVEESAPSPTVPRVRDEDVKRPKTAPHATHPSTDSGRWLRRRDSLKDATLSLRKHKVDVTPVSSAVSAQKLPPTAGLQAPDSTGWAFLDHHRPGTLRSDSGRGYVDLLDAQSEIHPSELRGRARTAGLRDYGEDVADRNIGANGVNLDSMPVRNYYASSVRSQPLPRESSPSRARVRRIYDGKSPSASARTPAGSGFLTKSLNSSHAFLFPRGVASRMPQWKQSPSSNAVARSSSRPTPDSPDKPSAISPDGSSVETRVASLHGALDRPVNMHPRKASRDQHRGHRRDSPHADDVPPVPKLDRLHQQATKRTGEKEVTASSKPNDTLASDQPEPDLKTTVSKLAMLEADPHLQDGTNPEISTSASDNSATKRHSIHTIKAMASFSNDIDSDARDTDDTSALHQRQEGLTGYDLDEAMPYPVIKSHSRNDSYEHRYGSPKRKNVLLDAPSRSDLGEIEGHVPRRKSSLRQWSLTSTSPTASSVGSNLFQRHNSRHTPNTSVDLSNTLPSIFSSSRSSLHSSSNYACSSGGRQQLPFAPKPSDFNIDDYLSEDDDVDIPRRVRGEGEEDLLFREAGYGFGLPGLSDSFDPPSILHNNTPRITRGMNSLPSIRQAYGSTVRSSSQYSQRSGRRVVDRTSLYYDSEEEEDDSSDGEMFTSIRLAPGQDRRALKRLSAIESMYNVNGYSSIGDNVIEEEKLEKIDVAAAVRARKEAKAKQRAMAMAMAKARSLGATGPDHARRKTVATVGSKEYQTPAT